MSAMIKEGKAIHVPEALCHKGLKRVRGQNSDLDFTWLHAVAVCFQRNISHIHYVGDIVGP
jgi:hypothetical protein